MRQNAPPGAFGLDAQGSRNPVEPSPRKRKRSPSDSRRDEARAQSQQRRGLDRSVAELHDIRSERDPLARRHLAIRVLDEDDLRAKDYTRPLRAADAERDIAHVYSVKRGEAS